MLRGRIERIELPLALLADPDAASELRRWMRFADDIYFRLRGLCAGMTAAAMPDPDHKDTKKRSKEILDKGPTGAVFFSAAERALPGLMQRIAAGDGDATYAFWMKTLKTAALLAWEAASRTLGNSPAALRAEARAYPRFRGLLRTLEPIEPEQTATEATA
jgi:CRISPR system Cascade subunit CasA